MATDSPGKDFVTIVPVGESQSSPVDPAFVTVLTLGEYAGAAKVVVRRPRGDRLGLGLKFEGGSAAAEKVRRLLVQSCTEDSPAANASTPWGKLIPGDEILSIDGVSVPDLTRIDCVRRLKDSDEILTLLVRHFDGDEKKETKSIDVADCIVMKPQQEITKTLPPPVPPRKFAKKNSFKEKSNLSSLGEQNIHNGDSNRTEKDIIINGHSNVLGNNLTKLSRKSSFDSHLHRQNKESVVALKRGSPEEVRRLVRRLSDGKTMPPEAEVYIDLLSTEWERCLALADAESDDTGSSISTVVDRLSSMASSVDNSIPSTPIMQPKTIDLHKVLNCIENIESDILKDIEEINSKNMPEQKIESKRRVASKNKMLSAEHSASSPADKKDVQNYSDKNNNNTNNNSHAGVNSDIDRFKQCSDTKHDSEPVKHVEKPKPMPRSTKIDYNLNEKRVKSIALPESLPPSVPDTLLTPTKKNCIETWLQRSEAEMIKNDKEVDRVEEIAPEALPRLIDFVPKPQFKESEVPPTAMARPTTAPPLPPLPPLPPVEAREDGSGASLDTIGELDEPSDLDTGKQKNALVEIETKKIPTFWDDRALKSDTEDKSLSNDESPPPTCPRQPPDGVETPNDVIEKPGHNQTTKLPPRLPTGWVSNRTRLSYSRAQDPKSEASVKDKIAMFSNDRTLSSDRIDKYGTLPVRISTSNSSHGILSNNLAPSILTLDRRLTKSQDNLDDVPRIPKGLLERPEILGAPKGLVVNYNGSYTPQPLFYGSTTTLRPSLETCKSQTIYHTRSSSDDSESSRKSSYKSNLENLIEQRKKSMSKLRGLVIPEGQGQIMDLPEIKVPTKIIVNNKKSFNKNEIQVTQKLKKTKGVDLNESKWKTNLLSNNLPKYSPAFKRKSLQLYSPLILPKETSASKKSFTYDTATNDNGAILSSKPQLKIDITRSTSQNEYSRPSGYSLASYTKLENKDVFNNPRNYSNVEIKICTATEVVDSDNDSAMSSTQSSYRSSASSPLYNVDSIESDGSRVSPKSTHFTSYSFAKSENPVSLIQDKREEYSKRHVCRSVSSETNGSLSSSAGSAATSGSQASCSSLESTVPEPHKKKIIKTYSVDNVNRRNILASSKCRSGRDDKLNSPVPDTKFSHETSDKSPSPEVKSSERLSTLTPAVSANANKGDTRRRSKVIETDSDSDGDVNIRHRKAEAKSSRTKRNIISSNKNKSIDAPDAPRSQEPVKVIYEQFSMETKKVGLITFASKPVVDNIVKHATKLSNDNDEKEILTKKSQSSMKTKICEVINNVSPEISLLDEEFDKQIAAKSKPSITQHENKSQYMIRLKKGAGSGVGLILAGGTDCEAKDVTVHRVLSDSVAEKAGLKRGAKVCSINGCSMAGLTHAQSVAVLKEQRSEVLIEVEYETHESTAKGHHSNKEEVQESSVDTADESSSASGSVITVVLEKAGGGAGLGFGLDGGRDSPCGDRPLTIKKLFAGGAAARSGRVCVGAELISAGGQSMEGFTRTQAWAALKSLPTGPVTLVLRTPNA